MGGEVGIVDHYKNLDVHLNSRLDWKANSDAVCNKGMGGLFSEEGQIFPTVQQDAEDVVKVSSAVVCLGSSISTRDDYRNHLHNMYHIAIVYVFI